MASQQQPPSFSQGGYAPYGTAAAPAPAAAAASLSFDVTEADFEAAVLERSLQVPVLLDCWAPWCGPCRSLGPILEKLVQAYGGQFVLAKLNTDEAPQISAAPARVASSTKPSSSATCHGCAMGPSVVFASSGSPST